MLLTLLTLAVPTAIVFYGVVYLLSVTNRHLVIAGSTFIALGVIGFLLMANSAYFRSRVLGTMDLHWRLMKVLFSLVMGITFLLAGIFRKE